MNKSLFAILETKFGLAPEELADLKRLQSEKNIGISDALIQRNLLSEAQLLNAQSLLYDIPFWPDLPLNEASGELIQKVPIQFLKRHHIVPLMVRQGAQNDRGRETRHQSDTYSEDVPAMPINIIAINDPSRFQPLDELVRLLEINDYSIVLATKAEIVSAINLSFDLNRNSAEQLVQDMNWLLLISTTAWALITRPRLADSHYGMAVPSSVRSKIPPICWTIRPMPPSSNWSITSLPSPPRPGPAIFISNPTRIVSKFATAWTVFFMIC